MSEKQLRVFYMFNGLIVVAELVSDGIEPQIKSALALAPGQQQGMMQFMEAFPFTDDNMAVKLQKGSFITYSELGDPQLATAYEDAMTKMKAQKSGIILPK